MKVSIIIPTYNEKEHLPGCLNSISHLDYPKENIEVIVVDNGSTDQTREIAKSHNVKVLCDNHVNVSGLRNLGAKHSNGDILAFIDADCVVSRRWLKNASKYLNEEDVVAWGSPPTLPEDPTWVQQIWYLIRQKENQVQEVDWLETMNLFVRKDLFFEISGFNDSLVTCEDVDFCYRVRHHGRIISDDRLEVIHLGEASTLKEFIRKEIWRGRSNLAGISSHGLSLKELPSLSIPLYFGLFLPVTLLVIIVFLKYAWLFGWLLLYLFPSAAVLFKMRKKRIGLVALFRLLFLLQVYFFSRTIAILKKGL